MKMLFWGAAGSSSGPAALPVPAACPQSAKPNGAIGAVQSLQLPEHLTCACYRVLPARGSVRQLRGEAVGERRVIGLSWSSLLREWCRHSHWCPRNVMRPKYGVRCTSCHAHRNLSENKELILGLWSHRLLQHIQLQAAARRDVPTFSPYPWATTHIHLIIKWARSGTNSAENWSNQKISDKFSASLVSWSAMNASAEAQVFSFQP